MIVVSRDSCHRHVSLSVYFVTNCVRDENVVYVAKRERKANKGEGRVRLRGDRGRARAERRGFHPGLKNTPYVMAKMRDPDLIQNRKAANVRNPESQRLVVAEFRTKLVKSGLRIGQNA